MFEPLILPLRHLDDPSKGLNNDRMVGELKLLNHCRTFKLWNAIKLGNTIRIVQTVSLILDI